MDSVPLPFPATKDTKDPLPTVPFTDQLFALANITHIRDYYPTVSHKSVPDQEKHLRLLDGIALLLVTEAKSDVAAVMFEQTPSQVTFYYAKNRPCTAKERDYLDDLFRLSFSVTDMQECSLRLLNHVIPMCRNKILLRLGRLRRSLPDPLHVFDDIHGEFHEYLVAKMPHLFPTPGPPSVSRAILVNYMGQLRKADPVKCSDKDLGRLIRFASAFGSYKPLKDLIRDDVIVRRLRKLGNYYGAAKGIANTVARLRSGNQQYNADNVFLREVLPPPQLTTYMSSDHLDTLNRHGANCGLAPIRGSSLKTVYPSANLGDDRYQRVTHSVHAECTLAMHALAMHKDWTYVEIGVSKGSCWLCEQFLDHMRRFNVTFLVSNFHGKLQPGWTCPPGLAQSDKEAVECFVGEAVLEIIERVLNRRRSDSFPHAASDDGASKSVPDSLDVDDLGWVTGLVVEST